MKPMFTFPEQFTADQVLFVHEFLITLADDLLSQYIPQLSEHYERPHPAELKDDDIEAHGPNNTRDLSHESSDDFDDIPY